MILSTEQRLLCNIILRSNTSWDYDSIRIMREAIGATPNITIPSTHSLFIHTGYCLTCGAIHDNLTQIPAPVTTCPECIHGVPGLRPIKYKSEGLLAGEAKLRFLEEALYWPTRYHFYYIINTELGRKTNAT